MGLCFCLVVLLGCPVCGVCTILRVVGILLGGVWYFSGSSVSSCCSFSYVFRGGDVCFSYLLVAFGFCTIVGFVWALPFW